MFGSSFFYIQSCSNNAIVSPCILAVNQNGLNFLSKETHVGGGLFGGHGVLDRARQHREM